MLFLIYYGVYRETRLFYPNLALWLASNLLRGWTSVLLFVIFFEWCRRARAGTLRLWAVAIALVLVAASYPLIDALKWYVRSSAKNMSEMSLWDAIDTIREHVVSLDYAELFSSSLLQIVGRLQTSSSLIEIWRNIDFIRYEFELERFLPFWMEGIHGVVVQRLFYESKTMLAGVAMTKYLNYGWDAQVGDWITNIAFPSWRLS